MSATLQSFVCRVKIGRQILVDWSDDKAFHDGESGKKWREGRRAERRQQRPVKTTMIGVWLAGYSQLLTVNIIIFTFNGSDPQIGETPLCLSHPSPPPYLHSRPALLPPIFCFRHCSIPIDFGKACLCRCSTSDPIINKHRNRCHLDNDDGWCVTPCWA